MVVLSLDALMGHLVSFVSYRVVSVCLLSVPVTHFVGLYARFPKHSHHWKYWLFPFKGGNRHIVLQLMSWVSCVFAYSRACSHAVSAFALKFSLSMVSQPTIKGRLASVFSYSAAVHHTLGHKGYTSQVTAAPEPYPRNFAQCC